MNWIRERRYKAIDEDARTAVGFYFLDVNDRLPHILREQQNYDNAMCNLEETVKFRKFDDGDAFDSEVKMDDDTLQMYLAVEEKSKSALKHFFAVVHDNRSYEMRHQLHEAMLDLRHAVQYGKLFF
jgi:hypothetical protein